MPDDGTLTADITADAPHCDHDAVPFDLQPQMPNGNGQLPAGNGPFSSHYVGNMDERAAHSESHSANNDSNAQAFHSQEEHPRSSYASSDAIRGSRQSSPVQQNISNSASQPGLEFKLCQDPDPMHYDPSIQVNVISEKINQFQPEIGALQSAHDTKAIGSGRDHHNPGIFNVSSRKGNEMIAQAENNSEIQRLLRDGSQVVKDNFHLIKGSPRPSQWRRVLVTPSLPRT